MISETVNPNRKTGITVFIISIIMTVVLFFLGETYSWSEFLLSAEIISALIVIFSFLYVFIKIPGKAVSITRRRTGVAINYASLLILLVLFYIAGNNGLKTIPLVAGAVLAGAIIISFINVHMKTGLWKFVHTKIDKLDEREIQVTHESLRSAYSVFCVICLFLFLVGELIREYHTGLSGVSFMPIVGALIYLAHTLPASIIAWTEKEL